MKHETACDSPNCGSSNDPLPSPPWADMKLPSIPGAGKAKQCASECYADPRRLLDQEIERLNVRANDLYRLRRALPEDLSPQAARALVSLIVCCAR